METNTQPIVKLRTLSVDSFRLENPKNLETTQGIKLLDTEFRPGFRLDGKVNYFTELKTIQIVLTQGIYFHRDDNPLLLAEAQMAFDFEVDNYGLFVGKDGKPNFSLEFIKYIAEVAASTSRGLVISKLSNTFLSGLVIPLLNLETSGPPELIGPAKP